jgi:phage gp46-like protein
MEKVVAKAGFQLTQDALSGILKVLSPVGDYTVGDYTLGHYTVGDYRVGQRSTGSNAHLCPAILIRLFTV